MQTLTDIRSLLAARSVRPKHRLGQNFLHDHNHIRRLVQAATLAAGDRVLEVGPGTGALTEALLETGADVVACELDADMVAILRERISSPRLTIVHSDALSRRRSLSEAIRSSLAGNPFKLVANLPYQIASTLISTLLIEHVECLGQFVTIQREVADRLLAAPSSKHYGPLSVITQAFGRIERLATLPSSCFWPEPDVTSAMVAITPAPPEPDVTASDRRNFARFVTKLFSQRRKQLGTIIGRSHDVWSVITDTSIRADLRPEALGHTAMLKLWRAMNESAQQ